MFPSEFIRKMAKKIAEERGYSEVSQQELIESILHFEDMAWGCDNESLNKKAKEMEENNLI